MTEPGSFIIAGPVQAGIQFKVPCDEVLDLNQGRLTGGGHHVTVQVVHEAGHHSGREISFVSYTDSAGKIEPI